MSSATSRTSTQSAHVTQGAHVTIEPSILYFGTPVVLLSTENDDGSANLAPISSAWALGYTIVLGLGAEGQTAYNLARRPQIVINVPGPHLWRRIESLAGVTGRFPVPEGKPPGMRFEPDKFGLSGFTSAESELVNPPRVAECGLQFEAAVARALPDVTDDFLIVEARVLRVHADPAIVIPGTNHVEPAAWSPLIYNFRHYFGLGRELGFTYRSQTPRGPASQDSHTD
ncbi:flavin reductase (DIM6/NTAB) family NADH-FMN oxidoreductase RutF [Catenulispora sp. EB89]|uniref:flavin reductase family protein n=1 Tax=Catenulispora sp. EB89 TaxID=3156257 RepID=UPI0035120117